MKLNYIIIPLITIAVALIGSLLTSPETRLSPELTWYKNINKPEWTPPGYFIAIIWNVIFILSTISALIVWNKFARTNIFWIIIFLFVANAILNVGWSYIFFTKHLIGPAVFEAALLGLSVIALIIFIWPLSKLAASLLFLYAGWVVFAAYLTYTIWKLNL